MKLMGMHGAFKTSIESGKTEDYTSDEMVAYLVDSETDDRRNRKIERQLSNAKFRYKASMEEINYGTDRNLDKNQLMRLGDCAFINKHENILITGCTGIGKNTIASAIGHQACSLNYKVLYYNMAKLMGKLKNAKGEGSYMREIARIEKHSLLILDDFGLQPFDAQSRAILMEIIEDRHGRHLPLLLPKSR